MSTTYPGWPASPPSAETLIAHMAGYGQFCLGLMDGHYQHADAADPLAISRYLGAIVRMQHAHDVILLLLRLADFDPLAADRAAAQVWGAADAGDCYGEWLWEWATRSGLDPEAIRLAGVATLEEAAS